MTVVLAALPLAATTHPAGADPVTDLRSRAAAVAQNLVLEQLQVDAARQQTSVAAAKVADDGRAIARISRQLAADQQAIAHHLRIVQDQAIRSYINSGTGSSGTDAALFGGGTVRAQAASEYASLAAGNITAAMARLRTAQRALRVQQDALRARQSQDRADQRMQASALDRADTAAAALRNEQASVTGQLASAVAAQQSAQSRAAASAVARVPKTAAPRTDSASNTPVTIPPTPAPPGQATGATGTAGGTGGSGGDPYPNLPDPALNPFLACVVQAESGGNYGIVSPNGLYMGAFQFSQPTWNTAAAAAGLGLLVGVPPNHASRSEQDTVAVALYALDGRQPWLGDRCSQ